MGLFTKTTNSASTTNSQTTTTTQNTNPQGKSNQRTVTQDKTTINKLKDYYNSFIIKAKMIYNRVITKTGNCLYDIGFEVNKKAEKMGEYIKNIKIPFIKKNIASCSFFGFEASLKNSTTFGKVLKKISNWIPGNKE